jgi:hypothetical protein
MTTTLRALGALRPASQRGHSGGVRPSLARGTAPRVLAYVPSSWPAGGLLFAALD